MESISLPSLGSEKLAEARQAHSGRAAHTIHRGHTHKLRQTLVALCAGQELAEHESPSEATLQVLDGRVHLTAGDDAWEGQTGDYVVIPPQRHALKAIEDSVVILTVVVSVAPDS
ncbi:MAG TPA: cupin domain-containing protein [Mycobacterium sp.]|jgi:quercetin dioxygenase-like cupin family protein|nr:cupin domain-containing protein [Mycobacterium sp.]